MEHFSDSKWIWTSDSAENDEYAEFIDLVAHSGGKAELYISSDSNYAVYLNGNFVAFGQYADYPYMKVYDKIDLSSYMRVGKNLLAISVWHYGVQNTITYCPGQAGLIFSLISESGVIASSTAKTLSRRSPAYACGKCKYITRQMGLSFEYDARLDDNWINGYCFENYPFTQSKELDISPNMRPRSCKMPRLLEEVVGERVEKNGVSPVSEHGMIFDLGREEVGLLSLKFTAKEDCAMTVAFGEHLDDGHVRQIIGDRDFSFIYHAKAGDNAYMNPYRRFGARYVEIISDTPLENAQISLRPVEYPLPAPYVPDGLNGIQREIYDVCVHTLKCCMHEHYEDCPWREQALYAMDSRNQMLAGYFAFGETEFPRSNLELIAEDDREDGLLSMSFPMSNDLTIPSFSLHYITECEEYLRYSGDEEFISKILPKLERVLGVFLARIDRLGLIRPFEGEGMWNFYEWTDALIGVIPYERDERTPETYEYDLALNVMLSEAISRMIMIKDRLGEDTAELFKTKDALNNAIHLYFFDKERGLYETRVGTSHYSRLLNALCILAGVTDDDLAEQIAEKLCESDVLSDCSLSMRCFVYDALICVDADKYSGFILDEIERTYLPMLKTGNGTVWETVLGADDFDNAGSMCHGWSAIPIYYYNLLI